MYETNSIVSMLMSLFPDYPRIPFLIISLINFTLFYKLSSFYLTTQKDRVIALSIFVLLPGIISSATLADQSSLAIFATLLFMYAYKIKNTTLQIVSLILLLFVHSASLILFFAIFFYFVFQKNLKMMLLSLGLFTLAYIIHGFDVSGKPSGHFLELFALYAVVFSPLLYLYFLFSIYKQVINKNGDILVYICAISLMLSFLFSFRQEINIEDFAPYVVIATLLMVDIFSKSYHVRLKVYRKKYLYAFFIFFSVLLINSVLLLNHKFLFYIVDPTHHFATNFYQPYAVAKALKENEIECIDADSQKLQNQLRFYGINSCSEYLLHNMPKNNAKEIKIILDN
ncbi:MAG: hypothetical protein ACQESH_05260, partial [Campylobacterota bacterium]